MYVEGVFVTFFCLGCLEGGGGVREAKSGRKEKLVHLNFLFISDPKKADRRRSEARSSLQF